MRSMTTSKKPSLGVMVLYRGPGRQIEELRFLQKLMITGEKMGFNIFVFTPEDVNDKTKTISAYYFDQQIRKWRRKLTSFPNIIFDRCRYQPTARFKKLREFRDKYPNLNYLNRPMANKWIIHQYLHRNSAVRKYLPDTELVQKSSTVLDMLQKHRTCFFKPINGTGGRSILQIEKQAENVYQIKGRTAERKIIPVQKISADKLKKWIMRWKQVSKREFIVQQGIDIRLSDGRVHDFRLLIQKNGSGKWEVTGCAARVGALRSVTSNLHGGGKAVKLDTMLRQRFTSEEKQTKVKNEMYRLAHLIVEDLEKKYRPMIELALDIAVDPSGHPWLLEINPKPAREVFSQIGEPKIYHQAIRRPLEYALWRHSSASVAD